MDQQAFAELLGNYGQFIGAIAVVATLIYVAVQVRYAKRQVEINGFISRGVNEVSVLAPVANDPEFAALILKAGHPRFGDFGMDAADAQRVGAWLHMWMQMEQANHYLLPEKTHDESLRTFLSIPTYAEFWEKNKNAYDREFVARMDRIKAKVSPTGVDPNDLYARLD